MSREQRALALKEIAETLNLSNDMEQMLQSVLEKLLEVTGLTTGWIFLVGEEPDYTCPADQHLPPALVWENKKPMCSGECWCLERFWDGRLHKAVNIIECARIENAIKYEWGDTEGVTHHASVPLKAGDEYFGILNVASPGKSIFTQEELALLQSVAFQIGTAVKRTRLYQAQIKRAEGFAKLGQFSSQLGAILELDRIPSEAVRLIGEMFEWQSVALLFVDANQLSLRSIYTKGKLLKNLSSVQLEQAEAISHAIKRMQPVIEKGKNNGFIKDWLKIDDYHSAIAVPHSFSRDTLGVILATSEKKAAFDDTDVEILQSVACHITLAIENARLYEQRREISRLEERNRLARDLHDSVSQTLFSLNLTAKGIESLLETDSSLVKQSVQELQELSNHALKEMRSLIWQLRPAGLEHGLATALKKYGEGLGLRVIEQVEGILELSRTVEENLWRIGQEALNNVMKHSGSHLVTIQIQATKTYISMEICDQGQGFELGLPRNDHSMGMLSMRERAEMLGGKLKIESEKGKGTRLYVKIPVMD